MTAVMVPSSEAWASAETGTSAKTVASAEIRTPAEAGTRSGAMSAGAVLGILHFYPGLCRPDIAVIPAAQTYSALCHVSRSAVLLGNRLHLTVKHCIDNTRGNQGKEQGKKVG